MELTSFLDAAQRNDASVFALLLVTDFGMAESNTQEALVSKLKSKGFMELDDSGYEKDTLSVVQATFKRSLEIAARKAAEIMGLEIIEVTCTVLDSALNAYADREQIMDKARFDEMGIAVREAVASVSPPTSGPTAEECSAAAKIVLEVELPDGTIEMNICTACALHFIKTGEGSGMWMHPTKIRVLLAAIMSATMYSDTKELRVPREKLN